ncbi:MAG: hypothetical protein KTR18_01025 [Acidiferrobacterales bacterium]|nr:hypothetical protein [Acidiferrobacterales bacterium]
MTESSNQPDRISASDIKRSRFKFLAVLGFFFVPFFLAIVGYFFFPHLLYSGGRVNNAPLVEPVVTLEPFTNLQLNQQQLTLESLQKKWTVVHRLDQQCDESCEVSLYNTRQIRIALGKDTNRVQRVLLGSDVGLLEAAGNDHPDIKLVLRISEGLDSQLSTIVAREKLGPNDALLIDPLGNVMMAIPSDLNPTKLLKDLKKLLKLSKIG